MIHLVIKRARSPYAEGKWLQDYVVVSAHASKLEAEKRAAGKDTRFYRYEVISKRVM
ncbi:hypothetical protein HWC14_gp34 [Serratia phage Parlo]|uniref:Uncharacterized protein n=1 Tax=Serratia phage Parlo TaxID=2557554 RepID=A0A482MG62_9CAUD|nr:hypothetical protein HWC14_gp34 [Serratia phage Parlo]QBQ72183.1 hypothetical protein CPT_Parlo_034 [Serratia phage Parlo]